MEARDTAKHLALHKASFKTKNYSAQNANSTKIVKPCFKSINFIGCYFLVIEIHWPRTYELKAEVTHLPLLPSLLSDMSHSHEHSLICLLDIIPISR